MLKKLSIIFERYVLIVLSSRRIKYYGAGKPICKNVGQSRMRLKSLHIRRSGSLLCCVGIRSAIIDKDCGNPPKIELDSTSGAMGPAKNAAAADLVLNASSLHVDSLNPSYSKTSGYNNKLLGP